MNIRKDVQVAWNLIKIIEKDVKPLGYYHEKLMAVQGDYIGMMSLKKIAAQLTRYELIGSKQSIGIMRGRKRIIYFKQVLDALNFTITPLNGPIGVIQRKLIDIVQTEFTVNNFLGEIDYDDDKLEDK